MTFWRTKSLDEMSHDEWESLCDGCGKCCALRVADEDDRSAQPIVYETVVACRMLDLESCRCLAYERRFKAVPSCLRMTVARASSLEWLPETCGYSRVARGLDLPEWHPLRSGSAETVHTSGASARGRFVSEEEIVASDIEDYIIWPEEPTE